MLKKVIENIIFVSLLLILGISISPALPFKNIPRIYAVISGSMEPTIKTGSVVLTTPIDPKLVKVGDVVAFTSPSNSKDVILHRISAIKSTSPLRFQTKGDNNNTPDSWDLMDVGILGKQVFTVPYLGRIAHFVRTPVGFILIIGLPALLIIISQIISIKNQIKLEVERQVKSRTLPTLLFFLSFLSASSLLLLTSVMAKISSLGTISGASFSVKDFVPPPVPTLLSPANNITRRTDGMVMDWTDVSDYNNQHNPVYYLYESSHVSDFSTLAYQSAPLSTSNIPAPGTPNGVYYWHVRACDSVNNCSAWTAPWKVTVDSSYVAPPPTPNLISPSDNSYNKGASLTQSWSSVVDVANNPVRYEYESCHVNPGLGPCTNLRWLEVFTTTSKTATNVTNATFWWRVRAINSANVKSPWSQVWKLVVDNTRPNSSIGTLPPITNQTTLNIGYTATDNNVVDHTDLCYSFNDPLFSSPQCSTNFNFNFPAGEGTYYFFTRAVDAAGNIENVSPSPSHAVVYDITPPTTNLIIGTGTTNFSGQNMLIDSNWTSTGHVLSAGTSFQLGVGASDSTDILVQKILLPHNLSSNFSFSYNYSSTDTSEFDNLTVGVSTGTGVTNILNFGGTGVSGWQTLSHSLLQWAGQTVDVFFKLINSDQLSGLSTSVTLKDIAISPLDLRTGDTTPASFLATDLGSGVNPTPTPFTTSIGDTAINISSTDLASNIESTHSVSVVTLPPIVLNKITNSIVTIYNNTSSAIDLSSYSLDLGTTMSGTISGSSSLDIPVAVGTTKVSLLDNSLVVDSTTFESLGSSTWQRQSNGLGPWIRLNAPVSFDLQSRLSQSKITFTVSGLGVSLPNMDYTINYFGNGQDQQIAGTIAPNTVDTNGTISRDFYLGTCSSGTCIPASGIGSSFVVTFSSLPSKTFILN